MILNLAAGLLVLLTSPAWLGHLLAAHVAAVWQREPERVLAASGAVLLLACVAAASRETQWAWLWPGDRLFRWLWRWLAHSDLRDACTASRRESTAMRLIARAIKEKHDDTGN